MSNPMPFGFCPDCLEKFANGSAPVRAHKLPDGAQLLQAYCEHRECGGTMLLREGSRREWRLFVPCDVLRFKRLVELQLAFHQ